MVAPTLFFSPFFRKCALFLPLRRKDARRISDESFWVAASATLESGSELQARKRVMETDWKSKAVVDAYAKAMWPYGDIWRMALVNPVILQTAQQMCSAICFEQSDSRHSMPLDSLPLDLGLVVQREALKCSHWDSPQFTCEALSEWHKQLLAQESGASASLNGLNVLDLGCGEGYLGRILTKLGATYLGIDVSAGLLNIAECGGWGPWIKKQKSAARSPRAKGRKQVESLFACADLEGDPLTSCLSAIKSQLDRLGNPNLVVMTIVFDHLQNPGPVLSWISQILAAGSGERAFLLFALNRDYFDLDRLGSGDSASQVVRSWVEEGERITHFNACIHSAQQPVGVYIRSKRIVERYLRDARFRVVQSMPLYFWYGFSCDKQPPSVRGIPPFTAFLARPLPRSNASCDDIKSTLEKQWSTEARGLLKELSEMQKKLLLDSVRQLEIIRFAAGQVAIGQHSLGGDLFVVLDGSLDLRVNDEPDLTGEPGQVFGELETGPQGRVAHYPYPVVAGVAGATILRIPSSVAEHLTDKDTSFGMSLFRQLRDRLVVWNWTNTRRTDSSFKMVSQHDELNEELGMTGTCRKDSFEVISLYADRVARVLLAASEEERQCGKRDSEGRCILLDFQQLQKRLRLPERKEQQELSLVLRKLTVLGIVDAFPGDDLRKYFKSECNMRWDQLVEESGRVIFDSHFKYSPRGPTKIPITSEGAFWSIVRELHTANIGDISKWEISRNGVPALQAQIRKEHLPKMDKQRPKNHDINQWESLVRRWYRFLWNVNRLFFGGRPNFYVIHDPTMLRRFVLDKGQSVNHHAILRHRALTAISDPFEFGKKGGADFSDIVSSIQEKKEAKAPGRATFYLQRLADFCLSDLRFCDGRLAFSGSNEGFLPPASWDT